MSYLDHPYAIDGGKITVTLADPAGPEGATQVLCALEGDAASVADLDGAIEIWLAERAALAAGDPAPEA